jgi:uncharacterized protein
MGDAALDGIGAIFEPIERAECFELLASQTVGRLAVSRWTGPLVVPVNFVLDGESIVFRSGPGTKLRSLAARPVSFQVDEIDPESRTGWSVLARGRAQEVSGRDLTHLDPAPWAPDERDHWVRLTVIGISGRRIRRRK